MVMRSSSSATLNGGSGTAGNCVGTATARLMTRATTAERGVMGRCPWWRDGDIVPARRVPSTTNWWCLGLAVAGVCDPGPGSQRPATEEPNRGTTHELDALRVLPVNGYDATNDPPGDRSMRHPLD